MRLINETPGIKANSDFLVTYDMNTNTDICFDISADAVGPYTDVTFEANVEEC